MRLVTELPMFVPVVCIMSAPRHAATVVNTFSYLYSSINYNTSPIIQLLGPHEWCNDIYQTGFIP